MIDLKCQAVPILKRKQRISWYYIKRYCPEYISKSKRFNELLLPYLGPEVEMVDLGCGRGLETEIVYKDQQFPLLIW